MQVLNSANAPLLISNASPSMSLSANSTTIIPDHVLRWVGKSVKYTKYFRDANFVGWKIFAVEMSFEFLVQCLVISRDFIISSSHFNEQLSSFWTSWDFHKSLNMQKMWKFSRIFNFSVFYERRTETFHRPFICLLNSNFENSIYFHLKKLTRNIRWNSRWSSGQECWIFVQLKNSKNWNEIENYILNDLQFFTKAHFQFL